MESPSWKDLSRSEFISTNPCTLCKFAMDIPADEAQLLRVQKGNIERWYRCRKICQLKLASLIFSPSSAQEKLAR